MSYGVRKAPPLTRVQSTVTFTLVRILPFTLTPEPHQACLEELLAESEAKLIAAEAKLKTQSHASATGVGVREAGVKGQDGIGASNEEGGEEGGAEQPVSSGRKDVMQLMAETETLEDEVSDLVLAPTD